MDDKIIVTNPVPPKRWLPRILATAILILAIAASGYAIYTKKFAKDPAPEPQSNEQVTPPPMGIVAASWGNAKYGIKITHHESFQELSPESDSVNQASYLKPSGEILGSVVIPKALHSGTNLNQAFLTVSAKSNSSEADCKQLNDSGIFSTLKTTTKLGDNNYYSDKMSDAAAGTRYDTRIYHIMNNGSCVEFAAQVSYGNIGNYEPGAVKEVNVNEIFQDLESVIASATFTQTDVSADGNKIYTDKNRSYSFTYSSNVAVGAKANNSVLGTADINVPGIYVGNYVFVVADTQTLRNEAEEYFGKLADTAKNPPPVEPGFPSIECKLETVENSVNIQLVSCTGEGGPAVYGLVKGTSYDIFVDGYSRGWDSKATLKTLPYDDLKKILQTFKF